jgi:PDZ domain-containing secreted protein
MGKRATVITGSSNFGLILKNWKDVKGAVICDVMPTSCLKGQVFTGDRIILINGINKEAVADVTNLPEASEYYIDIVHDNVRLFSSTQSKPTHRFTAPAGRIGLELTKNHVVKSVLPDSPLAGKVLANDRLVAVNELDVREVSSANLVEILKGKAAYERDIGIE